MGVEYDTRVPISYAQVDDWIANSPEFPHVVGTSANEFSLMFESLSKVTTEILVIITSSRKIIHSHAAATAAVRSVGAHPSYRH